MADRYTPGSTPVSDWEPTPDPDSRRIQLPPIQSLQTPPQGYSSSWGSPSMESGPRGGYVAWKVQSTPSGSRFDIPIDPAILVQDQQQQPAPQRPQSAPLALDPDRPLPSRMTAPAEPRIEMPPPPKPGVRKSPRKRKSNSATPASAPASKTKKTTKESTPTSTNDSNKDTRAPAITLDRKEDIMLIQLCIKYSESFGVKGAIKNWWSKIGEKFNEQLGKPFTNHNRYMRNMVKDRKFAISMLETGDEDEQSPWQQAIDEWIEIFDQYENTKDKKKLTDQEREAEDANAEKKRQSMLNRMKDKHLLEDSDESSVEEISTPRTSSAVSTPGPSTTLTSDIDPFATPSSAPSTPAPSSRSGSVSRAASKTPGPTSRTKGKRAKADAGVLAMQSMAASVDKWVESKTTVGSELEEAKRQLTAMQEETKEVRREQQLQASQLQEQGTKLDSILEAVRALRGGYTGE